MTLDSKQDETGIPASLGPVAHAAVSWINQTQQQTYELTGLVDYESALNADPAAGYELGLILCDGETCAREQVHVQRIGSHDRFSLVEPIARDIPALLDPPEGVRREWLVNVLAKHEFVLLLFYRGLW